jgi:hypothetical protein
LRFFKRLVDVWNAQNEKRLIMDLPGYNELKEKGVGAFFELNLEFFISTRM